MTATQCTPNGTTISDGTTTYEVMTMSGLGRSIPALDDTILSSTEMEKCPGDLDEWGDLVMTIRWQPSAAYGTTAAKTTMENTVGTNLPGPFPALGTSATWTIAFQGGTGSSEGTLTLKGFMSATEVGELTNNVRMTQSITITVDGKAAPTWAAAAA